MKHWSISRGAQYLFASCIFLLSIAGLSAQTVAPLPGTWDVGGLVNSMIVTGGTVYIGGNFSHLATTTGATRYGSALDITTGMVNLNFPKIDNSIAAIAPDGAGGWYIGGTFTKVGGVPRNRIARINADGTLHPWNPDANGPIVSIAVGGNTVYVAGLFTSIGGIARIRMVALDATVNTNNVTAWNPNANGEVKCITVTGNTVYVGGQFTAIGGASRNRLAALNATVTTNNATAWDPNANGEVRTITVAGNTIYAGGLFSNIGGLTRNGLAAIDGTVTTNNVTAWNPNANAGAQVFTIAVTGNTVYVGGTFTSMGGAARTNIAALDATVTTNSATAWNPGANQSVESLVVRGNTVYAVGAFTIIGNALRNYIGALDATVNTNNATAWNPNASAIVRRLVFSGNTIYIGGDYIGIGSSWIVRNHLAALDALTGQPTSWNPNANLPVSTLALRGNTLYLGGSFLAINGITRNRLAAIDIGSTNANAWNPGADNQISCLALSGDTLYAGGLFTTIGGVPRNRIASLDAIATTNIVTAWNPNSDNQVLCLVVSGSTVYAGGVFSNIGGAARSRIAALSTTVTTNNATAWNPNANSNVACLVLSGNLVYAGGSFTNIGGVARIFIAALSVATGTATAWNPIAGNSVSSLAIQNNTIYAGGSFITIGGANRSTLARLDATINTGNATSWNVNPASGVLQNIIPVGNLLYVSGFFTNLGGESLSGFAILPVPATSAPTISVTSAAISTNEDVAYVLNVSISDAESATTALVVRVTSANQALVPNNQIVQQGATAGTTQFLITPTADANGVADIILTVTDRDGLSSSTTVTLTVRSVNDLPSFAFAALFGPFFVFVNEDSGPYSAPMTKDMNDGDPEVTQNLTFHLAYNNPELFSVQPAISPDGILTFVPAPNISGVTLVAVSMSDDGGNANGGISTTATRNFSLIINPVNDAPTMSKPGDVVMFEDAPSTTVTLAGIGAGAPDEGFDALTITATSSNISMIPNPTVTYTSPASTGSLKFQPVANAAGTVLITVKVTDNGGTDEGGVNTYSTTFTVTIIPINDPPVFSTGAAVTVSEDSGPYSLPFATGIDDGDPETEQALTVHVTNNHTSLFSVQPTISVKGSLIFTPAPDANGVAVVSVSISDDGGTTNGGVSTSATQTFTITVLPVNDAPSFTIGANQSVLDEDGPQTVPGWMTAVSPGPVDEAGQSVQAVVTADNPGFFVVQPTVSSTGTLAYIPAHGAQGTAIVNIYLADNGGTAHGGVSTSATQTFTITIGLSPVTHLRVTSVTPTPAESGQTIHIAVESRTALGTLRETTSTTTLGLVYDGTYLPVLSGSTQSTLAAGNSTATIALAFFSSSTASISTPITVRDMSNVLSSTFSDITVQHAVPSGLIGTVDNQKASLSWTAPVAENITGYVILRGTVSGLFSDIATTTATAYTDSTISNGSIYYYALKSLSGSLRSGQTAAINLTVPAIIANLTATARINAIRLDWSGSTSAGVTGYEIYTGVTSGNLSLLATVAATSASYTHTGLSDGVRYFYAIKTLIGNSQKSAFSTEVSAAPNTLHIVSPNGGEHWQAGLHQTIQWLYSGDIHRMRLEFSYDAGVSWSPLSESVLPTINRDLQNFFFDWEVPNIPSTTALVRVISLGSDAVTMSDTTDSYFEIMGVIPPVNLTATAGSTSISLSWGASTTASITGYRVLRGTTTADIRVLAGNIGMATNYVDVNATTCTLYYYAVQALVGNAQSDISNMTNATVLLPGSFTVVSPNGGEIWQAGLQKQIQWISTGCTVSSTVTLEYSVNNGGNWVTIATVANMGNYTWTIPDTPGTQILLRVSGLANGSTASDIGNSVFTIAPIAPPTNLTAIAGNAQVSLGWNMSAAEGVTTQSIYRGTTSSSMSLLASMSSTATSYVDGSVTNCTPYYYAVRASVDIMSSASSNVTNATPQIPPSLVLHSPNGNEVWQTGISRMITWSSTGCTVSPTIGLEYSTNNGVTWTAINGSVPNTGSYSWILPSISTIQARVRVSDGSLTDISDHVFTINTIAPPTNLSATGGDGQVSLAWTPSVAEGQTAQEVWRGVSAGNLALYAAISTTATSYLDVTTANCTSYFYAVRTVVGANVSVLSAVSSATPQIPAAVTVLSPNGGEVWQAGLVRQIQWSSTGCSVSATVMIEYSINNGGIWSTIVASTSNSGSYNWTVPNTPGTQARLRITGNALTDMSDAAFTIMPLPVPIVSAVSMASVSYCVGNPVPLSISVNISDPVYPVSTLSISIVSSNPAVVPVSSIAQNGITGATTSFIISPTTNASGSTVITITADNGLASSSTSMTVNIIVHARPVADMSGSKSVCAQQSASYGVALVAGSQYYWNVSGGSIISGQGTASVQVLWSGAGTGLVSVTVTNASGCTQSSSSSVTINSNPVPVVNANGPTTFCPGGSVQLTVSTAAGYLWSNGATSQSIVVSTGGIYSVMVFNASGCSAGTSATVTVLPQVFAEAGSNKVMCAEGSTQLEGNGTSLGGNLQFHWSPEAGLSNANIANPIVSTNATTTYTLTVTDINGCHAASEATVMVLPVMITSISSNVSICAGASTQLMAGGGVSYRWSPVEGLNNPNIANPVASATTTTTYSVLITNAAGCQVSTSVTVTVHPLPVADAGADIIVCAEQSVQLQATGGISYRWSPPEGLSNPNIANPIASPATTTTYVVTVTNISGCSSTDAIVVRRNVLSLNITAILEGAYTGSTMATVLQSQGLVPMMQPYKGTPFNYDGSESVANVPGNVVDWVLVELRTSDMSTVARKAVFLRSDGQIVGSDGGAVLMSPGVGAGGYYIIVRHRNHLAVMSSMQVSVDGNCGMNWNFTYSGQAYEQFASAMKEVQSGVFALVSGDVNADGVVNAADRVEVRNETNQTGYVRTDINLDGIVNATDRVLERNNVFRVVQVP